MAQYSIAEEFTLPSEGKIYDVEVNPVVKLRSMTTNEEMLRLSPSESSYKIMSDILDACMIEPIGISAYDLHLADYQFLLHKLRTVTYGSKYSVISKCPHCLSENEDGLDLGNMEFIPYDEKTFNKYIEFKLPKTGKVIKLRFQTPRMLDNINKEARNIQKKTKNLSGDTTYIHNLISIIDTIDGYQVGVTEKELILRDLPMADTNCILQHAERFANSFGFTNKVVKECMACRLDYTTTFRYTTEFFRPTIDI